MTAGGSKRRLISACCLCGTFMVVEVLAGLYSGSLAIVADAAHMLSDLCSFGISLVAIYMAQLPPTNKLSFGYQRAEMVGAFISIMLIWVLTIWLVVEAVKRVLSPSPVRPLVMIGTALFGILSNIGMALILSGGHGHGHGHGHSHGHIHGGDHAMAHGTKYDELMVEKPSSGAAYAELSSGSAESSNGTPYLHSSAAVEGYKRAGEALKQLKNHPAVCPFNGLEGPMVTVSSESDHHLIDDGNFHHHHDQGNVNVWAAYLHTLGDLLQNIGVLVAGVIIYWNPQWTVVDPLCTVLFAVIVICTTFGLIEEALMLLMEGTPRGIQTEDVAVALKHNPKVNDLHDLHIWSLAPGVPAMACHLVVLDAADSDGVLEWATTLIQKRFHVLHTTIQVDTLSGKAACATNAHENCTKSFL